MSVSAHIQGELTTSAKALPLLMDLIGQWTSLEGSQMVPLPQLQDTITLSFDDTCPDLATALPQVALRLAKDYPNLTEGQFNITGQNGHTHAESYRIDKGKLYRRSHTEVPERRVVLHRLKATKASCEVLVTERDLLRLARPRRNGHHKPTTTSKRR